MCLTGTWPTCTANIYLRSFWRLHKRRFSPSPQEEWKKSERLLSIFSLHARLSTIFTALNVKLALDNIGLCGPVVQFGRRRLLFWLYSSRLDVKRKSNWIRTNQYFCINDQCMYCERVACWAEKYRAKSVQWMKQSKMFLGHFFEQCSSTMTGLRLHTHTHTHTSKPI